MSLYRYSRNELLEYGKKGYKMYIAEDENEAVEVRQLLRKDKRCAIAGIYKKQKDGELVYFVISKPKEVRGNE